MKLNELSSRLRRLPRVVALHVAEAAAPAISAIAQKTFDQSETPDGVPWAPGVDGRKITLRKTGALERFLRYVAAGAKLRVSLGVPYAKYQIGKRPVFPRQGKPLPTDYVKTLTETTARVVRRELGQ